MSDPNAQVSVEQDGRILTGVGVDAASLEQAMSRESAEPVSTGGRASEATTDVSAVTGGPAAESAQPEKPGPAREDDGTFKKLTKGQRRFQELEHERDTFRTRAESAQQRAERVEREFAEFKRQQAAAPPTPEPAPTSRQKPTWNDTLYSTYEDFTEDLADWKAEQREIKVRADFDRLVSERIEADRAGQRFTSHVRDIQTRGRETYQDFDAVLGSSDVLFSPVHQQAILEVEGSEHVQYALGKDRALAERIAAMPTQTAADMLRLGLEFSKLIPSSRAVSPASTRSTVTSQAPAPYQPVGSGSKTTSPPLEELAAAGNYDAYKARRSSELRVAARR